MPNKLFDVSGKVVVITGVSGQLGNQYASTFLQNNAMVVGLDLNTNAHTAALEKEFDHRFLFIAVDITNKSALEKALAQTQSHFGTPNVLINNAAIDFPPGASNSENGRFEDYPEASWNKVMNVNVNGTFLVTQVFGDAMARNLNGSIINISSIYGVVSPDQSIYEYKRKGGEVFFKPVSYSVSKSALMNFTKYLAVYWAKAKVRVNTLVIAGVANNQDNEFLDAYTKRIPIGRMAEKDEYNGAVLFLASEASKYMTGAELIIDGGWTAI